MPTGVILDQWAALITHTDDIAASFVTVLEQHILPSDWHGALNTGLARPPGA